MIPLRDTIPSRNYPIVNNFLIAINIVFFLLQVAHGIDLRTYGLIPARYSASQIADNYNFFQQLFSLISYMFLHGGFLHLLGNMWSLYIFGDNIEDRLGHFRYLVFYLLCGIASGLFHLLLNIHSVVPTIGASGAIAGVMGAYFILYPRAKILTLIPIIFIPYFVELPAFFFLGFWLVLQVINAAASHGDISGIAWWAHVGGFVSGIFLLKMFVKVPVLGFSSRLRNTTVKKKSPRLQVIRPAGPGNDPNLYGTISILPIEAHSGTTKLVTISWGIYNRTFKVFVPPGARQGTKLRLKGLGKSMPDRQKGDLYLKVNIQMP